MGTRVLLVDDRHEVFEYFHAVLDDLKPLTLLYAETEAEARRVFLAQQPQIVILDGWLDQGDSLNLLRYIRNQNFRGPIIAYTSDGRLRQKMLETGCTCAWPKPCNFEQIVNTLNNLS